MPNQDDKRLQEYKKYLEDIDEISTVFLQYDPDRPQDLAGRWDALKSIPPKALSKTVNMLVAKRFREVLHDTGISTQDFKNSPIISPQRASMMVRGTSDSALTVTELLLFLSTMRITPQFFFHQLCLEMEEIIRNPLIVDIESTEELNDY